MPNLLTLAEVRDHVEIDLIDDALQQIIDAADAEIIRRLGPLATQTEVLEGGDLYLSLAREASAVTAVTERFMVDGLGVQDAPLTAANDISLLASGRRVERLFTGDNPSSVFRGVVTIAYTPADTTAERKMVLIKLVKLDVKYSGIVSKSIGDVRTQFVADHAAERLALFRSLGSSGRRLIT
jgi:hypothetical protein